MPAVTDNQTHHDKLLAASHAAVIQFGAFRLSALARTTIWHLRRIPASGIWGDDYAFRTLWDEFCHEVQEGPFDMPATDLSPWSLSSAFEMTIRPFVDELLEKLSRAEAVLLTLYVIDDLEGVEKAELAGSVYKDALAGKVIDILREAAGSRDLLALGSHRIG
jgi:hypothetical protein